MLVDPPIAISRAMRGMLKVRHALPPLYAVPTTSGTGSEVTVAAVVTDEQHRKVAVTDFALVPRVAVLDPTLTYGMPAGVTAASGMEELRRCSGSQFDPIAVNAFILCMKRRVVEQLFHARLRVVKVAAHTDHMRVPAFGGGHLELLHVAHAIRRVKHGATGARHIAEALQRGLARIPAGGDQNADLPLFLVLLGSQLHQIGQELEGNVLKSERRAVKQLQHMASPCEAPCTTAKSA